MVGQYRIGIVGCGDTSATVHMPTIVENPRTVLTSVCDPVTCSSVGNTVSGMGDVRFFSSHTEMLDSGLVDAVIVAVTPEATPQIGCDILQRGIPIYVESPIAATSYAGRLLVEAVEEAQVTCQVGLLYRADEALKTIKNWIDQGRLGTTLAVRMDNYHQGTLPVKGNSAESPMMSMGGHLTDALAMTFSAPAVSVQGWAVSMRPAMPQPNHWVGLGHYSDGGMATVEVGSRAGSGQQNTAEAPDSTQMEFRVDLGVATYRARTGELKLENVSGKIERLKFPRDSFRRAWAQFVKALDDEVVHPPSNIWHGYRSLIMTTTIEEAVRRQEVLPVPLDLPVSPRPRVRSVLLTRHA